MAREGTENDRQASATFRWAVFFRDLAAPLFVLNARQRLLHVNAAWEQFTGFTLADVRGQPCRRHRAKALTEKKDLLLAALAPPVSVKQGRGAEVRRRLPTAGGPVWALVHFFALQGPEGETRFLGKIERLGPKDPLQNTPLPEKLLALHDQFTRAHALDRLPQGTPQLERLHDQVRLAAQTQAPVSLVGPAGAGKQWLARAIHHETFGLGRFFASVDCARLPADAVTEVFLQSMAKPLPLGTIYLQTPERLPRDVQARLSQWLDHEEPSDRPRLLAGFQDAPHDLAERGLLLPELACRLSVLVLTLPKLADRSADWPWLIDVLCARAAVAADKPAPELASEARTFLTAHNWPGQLAELYQVLLSAVARAKGPRIEPGDLPFYLRQGPRPAPAALPLDALLEQVERKLLSLALKLTKNKKNKAAELLAIWRPRLLRRLEALGMDSP